MNTDSNNILVMELEQRLAAAQQYYDDLLRDQEQMLINSDDAAATEYMLYAALHEIQSLQYRLARVNKQVNKWE